MVLSPSFILSFSPYSNTASGISDTEQEVLYFELSRCNSTSCKSVAYILFSVPVYVPAVVLSPSLGVLLFHQLGRVFQGLILLI